MAKDYTDLNNKSWKSFGGKNPGEYKSLAENLYASYVLLSESHGAMYGDWTKKQKDGQEAFCENVSKSIIKFLQDQTLTITDMKASCELERLDTAKYLDAHVRPQKDKRRPNAGSKYTKKRANVKVHTDVKTDVQGRTNVGSGGGGGPLQDGRGKAEDQRGIIVDGENGVELPKLELRKSGKRGTPGGRMTATGHAYIGTKARTIPDSDTYSVNHRDNKVKLLLIEKGTE
tara:strand:+ start:4055 stop:4744 length:690 start_codon:yes stop_codon:yes gene_type:complete